MQLQQQFHQEATLLAEVHHPNLPAVSDYFAETGSLFLVMDYIEGESLDRLLARYPQGLPEPTVLAYADQICAALEALHNRPLPIIFRDLKPGNIMVTPGGVIHRAEPHGTVKLIDLGIARRFKPTSQTDTLRMGTMGYAPPEQYRGGGQTDARSDVYALGATLHHLLTGRNPSNEAPFSFPPVRHLAPAVSQHTEMTVMRALAYDREQRWSSVTEVRAALSGWAAGPQLAFQVGAAFRPGRHMLPNRPGRRRRLHPLTLGIPAGAQLPPGSGPWSRCWR